MKRLMVMTGRAGKALLEINGDRSGAAVKYGGPGELWLFDGEGNSCRGGRSPFIPVGAMAVKNGTVLLTGGFAGRKELMERAKALIPILVPLFISAFRRADELATAMECRCYQGGEGSLSRSSPDSGRPRARRCWKYCKRRRSFSPRIWAGSPRRPRRNRRTGTRMP